MVYVARDGTVGGRKSIGRAVSDFIKAIYEFIMLFFHTIMNPPSIENAQSQRRTYAQRNGGRSYNGGGGNGGSGGQRLGRDGRNVRGLGNLQGAAEARMGGG